MRGRTSDGSPLQPGVNVDRVDVAAGLRLASRFGYDDGQSQTVLEYALMRWARGEEAGAERSALSGGIDFTSWKAVLAAALAAPMTANGTFTCPLCGNTVRFIQNVEVDRKSGKPRLVISAPKTITDDHDPNCEGL